jgi:hypothetical protein
MLKFLSAALILFSTTATAHEQECFTPEQMDAYNKEYNQVPLFSTTIYKIVDDNMITGNAEFVLNVQEGHWTMYSIYNDNEVCIEAFGDNFKDQYKGN